jgi:hypothetical protein
MKKLLVLLFIATTCSAEPRLASYAGQRSSGFPLIVNGKIDTIAVKKLAYFDDVCLGITPWAQDINGAPRTDVIFLLRKLNPNIRLWLSCLTGDFWLAPTHKYPLSDKSGFREVFDAINSTNGWVWGTDSLQWHPCYRVDLGNAATVKAIGDLYVKFIKTGLFDGIFMDCAHTSIAWTSHNSVVKLDYRRLGFSSLATMDSSRRANIVTLIDRLHEAGGCGFLVGLNGTGPKPPNLDLDLREGLGSLITVAQAIEWIESPGLHWLKAECWNPYECAAMAILQKKIAARSYHRVIISSGPDAGWPPYPIPR